MSSEGVKWEYCPECGSDDIHYEEGDHKQCANCYQEWFADIDYSDVVREHLSGKYRDKDAVIAGLRAELAALKAASGEEVERLRMQLAACGVVALCNTPESAAKARDMHPDYMSASCQDVMRAVDSEMALRAELDAIRKQEPVGSVYTMQPCFPGEPMRAHAQLRVALPAGTKLYAAPPAAAMDGGMVLPDDFTVEAGFDVVDRKHVPTITIKLSPIVVDDSKGWDKRDEVATAVRTMLAAHRQASQQEGE